MFGRLTMAGTASALLLLPAASSALNAQLGRPVAVSFSGMVSRDADRSLLIRQPDGSYAAFSGTLPNFPFVAGEPVSIGFKAKGEGRGRHGESHQHHGHLRGHYHGQVADDGIYEIILTSPTNAGGVETSGSDSSQLAIVHDAEAGTYTVSGNDSAFASSGATYGAETGALLNCAGSECRAAPGSKADDPQLAVASPVPGVSHTDYLASLSPETADASAGNFAAAQGTPLLVSPSQDVPGQQIPAGLIAATTNAAVQDSSLQGSSAAAALQAIPQAESPQDDAPQAAAELAVVTTVDAADSTQATADLAGEVTLLEDAGLDVPSGAPTDVPAPGMLLLFGAANAALVLRRRRARTV